MFAFGDEEELTKRKAVALKALPSIPDTGWKPLQPVDWPNLSSAHSIALDTETKDIELNDAGPGWARHKGHIVGISLAAEDRLGNRGKWYFPMRHELETHDNLPPDKVLSYVGEVLGNPHTAKIGANLPYDIGWLGEEGVTVAGKLHDVQFAEALIDNNAFVGLDILAHKYLKRGKKVDFVEDWVMAAYKPPKSKWRREIYRTPPRLIGAYGEDDAYLPLDILWKQYPILEAEGLLPAYELETRLIPMMQAMRRAGVRVNVEKAINLRNELLAEVAILYMRIETEFGFKMLDKEGKLSTHSNTVGRLLDYLKIPYALTAAGNPSVTKEWLEEEKDTHPALTIIHEIREREKIIGTFLQSYIIDKHVNGFLYPQFHQVKGEFNGTMVYRFASSDPNLQNIPSRTELGKRVRECFEPDPGHDSWLKGDYSQIHYRLLAHFAVDKGDGSAERLRQSYRDDPQMDYHMKVYKDVAPVMQSVGNSSGPPWSTDYTLDAEGEFNKDIKFHRRRIKNINFSGLYGVGEETVGRKYLTGLDKAAVKQFLANYHEGAPYINATMEAIAGEAARNGYVATLLGRRIRFHLWEPMGYTKKEDRKPALPLERALREYGTFIQLAGLYRAVNYKFQGSEPDVMKTGMLKCWDSGVFDITGVPRLTVHDELDWSLKEKTPEMWEAFRFIQHTMENAIPLRVPVNVDFSNGPNWGKAD